MSPQYAPGERFRQLEALLTPVRARLLLQLSSRRTMSEIATRMFIAPSTATYQVREMERAGLLVRCRAGSAVWVERSARGRLLLSLYGVDDAVDEVAPETGGPRSPQ